MQRERRSCTRPLAGPKWSQQICAHTPYLRPTKCATIRLRGLMQSRQHKSSCGLMGCLSQTPFNRLAARYTFSITNCKPDKRSTSNSPSHACTVALVLNVQMALALPQFHVAFDDLFETINQPGDNYCNEWRKAVHFLKGGMATIAPKTPKANQRLVSPEAVIPNNVPLPSPNL